MWCNILDLHHGLAVRRYGIGYGIYTGIEKRIERATVRFRLRDGRSIQLFHASGWRSILPTGTPPGRRSKQRYCMMRRSVRPSIRPWRTVKHDAGDINAVSDKEGLTSELLDQEIDKRLHPDRYIVRTAPADLFRGIRGVYRETQTVGLAGSGYSGRYSGVETL